MGLLIAAGLGLLCAFLGYGIKIPGLPGVSNFVWFITVMGIATIFSLSMDGTAARLPMGFLMFILVVAICSAAYLLGWSARFLTNLARKRNPTPRR